MRARYLFLVCVLAALAALPARAQDYSFAVPELAMEVMVGSDSAVRIVYDITFANRGRPIDIVDIGVPHDGYRISSVRAALDGNPVTDVRPSAYVKPGFEVHLNRVIPRGQRGVLHVEFDVPRMLYQDTTRDDFASLRITPTWFGQQYINGTTRLSIVAHLPAGITPDEVLWQDVEFAAKGIAGDDQHVIVGWRFDSARLTGPHRVGVSFPKRNIAGVVQISRWQLFEEWFVRNEQLRMGLALVFFVGFAWLFFRFSGGTGFSVFAVIGAFLGWLFLAIPLTLLAALIPLGVLIFLNERKLRRRKVGYLPAIAQVEGGGIKRGLAAQEAAVLLERPLGEVLGLVMFGLLKKGVVRQVAAEPLTVTVAEPFRLPDDSRHAPLKVSAAMRTAAERGKRDYRHAAAQAFFRDAAQAQKIVLHTFEHPFLVQLLVHPGTALAELDFGVAMRLLIEHVAQRLGGFDLSDSRDYYRSVVVRAGQEARHIGSIEMREKAIDRDLEWLLMGEDIGDILVRDSYRYRPPWTRGGTWTGSGGGIGAGRPDIGGDPSFGDVAASFAGWSENTMGNLAAAIQPGALGLDKLGGGLVDLSGADRITGEVLESFLSNKGGGGGGGGGCACAGCACACACAGGGR